MGKRLRAGGLPEEIAQAARPEEGGGATMAQLLEPTPSGTASADSCDFRTAYVIHNPTNGTLQRPKH